MEKEENDAGTEHKLKALSFEDIHKISTNLKPAGSLSVDQDAKTYNQQIAEANGK